MPDRVGFRAHARLLTMLGEQLIKNDRVALVELIKNSYDADATKVTVDFRGFAADFKPLKSASIVITDNGVGMTEQLVRTAWMNPATPSKKLVKLNEPQTTLGRVLQGEKGIGRFATFKLGSEVELVTRARDADEETTLLVDISALDEDSGVDAAPVAIDMYLDDIAALIDTRAPVVFDGHKPAASAHGTQLTVSRLRAPWTERLVERAYYDLNRLQPLMWGLGSGPSTDDFHVRFLRDGVELELGREREALFEATLQRAVISVRNGRYDATEKVFEFDLNARPVRLELDDPEVRALKSYKDRFLKDERGKALPRGEKISPKCGPFEFTFYVFDLDKSPAPPVEYLLTDEQKALVKEHRIYLYRDGVRVYPYGDPEDDWLRIDATRGVEGAGRTLSNDQTVGYINISQKFNPHLRDKTSREGLVENGREVDDFKALVNTVLRYVRKDYQRHLSAKARVRARDLEQHQSDRHIETLRNDASVTPSVRGVLDALSTALDAEREVASLRLAQTEQLAGVGLSVETASHDLILAGAEALRSARQIVEDLKLLDLQDHTVFTVAGALVTRLEFIASRFRDVQGLFVSTSQSPTEQDVVQALRRVKAIYARLHAEKGITFEIDPEASLRVASTEAAILQLLINLVDNATFWLTSKAMIPGEDLLIRAYTPDRQTLVLTDSGPGVASQDAPFIFEPFYSGKGEEGKGLGLYIARQNGYRSGFSVALRSEPDFRDLRGATFVAQFDGEGVGDDNS